MEEGFDSEDWRAWDKAKQEKRAKNRDDSARLLREAGIPFTPMNDGAHLIVTLNGHFYDFWPGTGLWKMRGSTQKHRGVWKLLKMLAPSNV
jgi:hypothetical protein